MYRILSPQQVSSILEQSPSDETRQAALTVLESTTLPKEGIELKGETKESIGTQISRVFVTREQVNEPSVSKMHAVVFFLLNDVD